MSASTSVLPIRVRYGGRASARVDADRYLLEIPTDAIRGDAKIEATLERPGLVRDALLALGDVLSSDLRRKPSDRSDYLAYLAGKGKKATKELWEAEKAYLAERYGEAVQAEAPLDPIVSVGPEGLSFEVFSRDESAYARLDLAAEGAMSVRASTPGTSSFELDRALLLALGRMRSYRKAELHLGPQPGGGERELRVPLRWLRAFGQVQAAATLPADRVEVAPIDLYNVLLSLRLRKAKRAPRALRYELVPQQKPRIVLEPWDITLEGSGPVFGGARPQVVRTWGRNRLTTLGRLLPHARSIAVHLVGPGLPAFYVLAFEGGTFTLALSGWTDSGWAGIATFDLLAPGSVDARAADEVGAQLQRGPLAMSELGQAIGRPTAEARAAALLAIQRGQALVEVGTGRLRHRPLLAQPIDADRIRFRDEREAQAHRLLERKDQVRIEKTHDLGGEGTSIEGEIVDPEAHRSYRTSFTLDREGRSSKAACSCALFRRAGLREGPCAHMIALRLLHAREQAALEEARGTEEGRARIRAETRTLIHRAGDAVTTYRLSLDHRQLVVRWGDSPTRLVRLFFSAPEDARAEYFARLDALAARGAIDASAAERA